MVLVPQAMSDGRMEGEVERLKREIREYAAKAVRVDAEEDELYGEGKEAHEIGGAAAAACSGAGCRQPLSTSTSTAMKENEPSGC